MAILSKIRDRSIALIAVIGLALFAFVLDPSTITDFLDSSKINEVGEVDGETISRQEYAEALDTYKTRNNSSVSDMQAAKTVWESILKDKIYTKQLEQAGVTIGETDVLNNIINSPSVQRNPQFLNEVGLFDRDSFMQFLKDTKESEDQNLWKAWSNYINEVGTNLKRDTNRCAVPRTPTFSYTYMELPSIQITLSSSRTGLSLSNPPVPVKTL